MSMLKACGAAAMLTAISLTQAPAQQVVWEPGHCAQFYPYANCQNDWPGTPTLTRITPAFPIAERKATRAWLRSVRGVAR
jgi:hypothetical protein